MKPGGVVLLMASLGSCRHADPQQADVAPVVVASATFNKDVASILFARCATCHRPGESGPFSLLTYADARKKARQIVKVTRRRIMPPWSPAPGHEKLVGERRLSSREIAVLAKWVELDTPEGDAADLPRQPKFAEGGQLRRPDLVVTLPEEFVVPAGGPDLFRNFVIPVPGDTLRYVEAVEIRPESPAAHHAILLVDRTRQRTAFASCPLLPIV